MDEYKYIEIWSGNWPMVLIDVLIVVFMVVLTVRCIHNSLLISIVKMLDLYFV
jgi:hypothetical protein